MGKGMAKTRFLSKIEENLGYSLEKVLMRSAGQIARSLRAG